MVAQKAAPLQELSDGRFILGLGAGENLNEHITGEGWPPVAQRQDILEEAVTIIRELHTGELVTWAGNYFRVDSARIWDAPEGGAPIAPAVSGDKSIERFAPLGDHLIAVEPDGDLVSRWAEVRPGGAGPSRAIGQIPICWAPDNQQTIDLDQEQFRWFERHYGIIALSPGEPHGTVATVQLPLLDRDGPLPAGN